MALQVPQTPCRQECPTEHPERTAEVTKSNSGSAENISPVEAIRICIKYPLFKDGMAAANIWPPAVAMAGHPGPRYL
jgi:hypothetical protein